LRVEGSRMGLLISNRCIESWKRMFNFEKLDVWKETGELAKLIASSAKVTAVASGLNPSTINSQLSSI
jgi:hypothetical protein